MALAEMCKARAVVHRSIADELAKKLQNLGCCEFVEAQGAADGGALALLRSRQRRVDELLGDARFVLRLLEPLEVHKESSMAKMLGDIPEVKLSDLAARVSEEKFLSLTADVREKEKKMTELRAEISRVRGLLAQTALLESIKYPLEFFTTGTDMISGAVYSVAKASAESMINRVASELGDYCEYQKLPCGEKDASVTFAVLFRREDAARVQQICAEFSANRTEVPKDFALTAAEEKKRLTAQAEAAEAEEAAVRGELTSMADSALAMARDCSDLWSMQRDRLASMASGVPTDEVLIWTLWTPKSCLARVEKTVREYDSLVEFSTVEPEEGELAPTLLKNPSWSNCMEPLTTMYGTPTYGGTDPTTLMAPFFFLFLGMCFGDAGYGLLLSGVFGYYIVRHDLPPTMRKFFVMLTIGMVFSVLVGAVTGSWFGDSVSAFPFLAPLLPLAKSVQFLDPMTDPMTLLTISLALGFIQILFGLLIAMKSNWQAGDKVAALADQGGWIVFLVGLLLFGLSASGSLGAAWAFPSKLLAIGGALILVATQGRSKSSLGGKLFSGVMSLYNVTGYLGDVLSYSRLLALGLGSAAVGMVINLLAKLVAGSGAIGIPLAILIFVLGHAFSIAVNLLGAFIHSLRLQYVEFFGKFYDANGRDFDPLRNTTQFAKLSGDGAGN